jgi:hypothetical protein
VPRQGCRSPREARTSGTHSPMLDRGSAWATWPGMEARRGDHDRRRGKLRRARSSRTDYKREEHRHDIRIGELP